MNLKDKVQEDYSNAHYREILEYDDVKEKVLEFENQLQRAIDDGCDKDYLLNVLNEHKRIFGDFEK